MADRTVVVRLRADIAGYVSALNAATKATDKFGDANNKNSVTASTGFGQVLESARKHEQAFTRVGTALLGIGAATTAGLGLAVAKFAEFDAGMSAVQAATGASETSLKALREAAIQAGLDTSFSATEAAGGIEELAKAGVSTADILGGGLRGALDLAAAGGISVSEAAETAASTLTQFGLSGGDVAHVADLLASGANNAQGGVSDLAAALSQSGLVASQFGLSVDDTVGALSAFASAGLLGSDAGTSFRSMLLRLGNPAGVAADEMKRLGLQAFDAQGNFVGLEAFAGQLQDRLGGLTDEQRNSALAIIFGQDAIRGANILYQQGAEGIAQWTDTVNDSGAAARTAAARLDNLSGDLTILRGSFETTLIRLGASADGPLRSIVQGATDAVNAVGNLSPQAQTTTLVLGGLFAAATTTAGGFLVLAPRILDTVESVRQLSTDMPRLTRTMGLLGKGTAIVGGVAALTAGIIALGEATRRQGTAVGVNELTRSLRDLGQTGSTVKLDAAFSDFGSLLFSSKKLEIGVDDLDSALRRTFRPDGEQQVTDFLDGIGEAFGATSTAGVQLSQKFADIDSALAGLVSSGNADQAEAAFQEIEDAARRQGISVDEVTSLFPQYKDAQIGAAEAAKEAGTAAEGSAEGIGESGEAADDAAESVKTFQDALASLLDQAQGVESATDDLESAYQELAAAGEDTARTLTGNSEAALDNREAVRGLVGGIFDLADAQARGGASSDELVASLTAQRDRLRESLIAMGFSAEEAGRYAAQVDPAAAAAAALAGAVESIPEQASTEVDTPGLPEAQEALETYGPTVDGIPPKVVTTFTQPGMDAALEKSNRYGPTVDGLPLRQATIFSQPGMDPALRNTRDLTGRVKGVQTRQATAFSQPGMSPALSNTRDLTGRVRNVPGSKSTSFFLPGMPGALGQVSDLTGRVRGIPGSASTSISAPGALTAAAQARGVRDDVNSIPSSRSSTITVTRRNVTVNEVINSRRGGGDNRTEFAADGAIFEAFAAGGVRGLVERYADGAGNRPRESHTAQIAPAGAMRVWAEPETGGEAYIPLGLGKRARSMDLLEQVAQRFGGAVQWYASGGLRAGERVADVVTTAMRERTTTAASGGDRVSYTVNADSASAAAIVAAAQRAHARHEAVRGRRA